MSCTWDLVTLGSTGLRSSPLGIGSSYGVGTADLERAFERGVNYFFWGSIRRPAFGRAIGNLAARGHRERMVVAVESYTRVGALMRPSVEVALRRLGIEYVDLLILGWWNRLPPRRIVDAALALRESGKVRHLMVSCHDRGTLPRLAAEPAFDALMIRYNAAHTGAENEVFPHLPTPRPGIVAFTATRWGALLDPNYTPPNERQPRGSDCYRFALSNPNVDVCLCGPKDGAELDEAMAALDRGPMTNDELAWMRRVGAHVHAAVPPRPGGRLMDVIDRLARAGGT
jgi:aryl-alcohol dehydrogenase-like predicted oxidoreductase